MLKVRFSGGTTLTLDASSTLDSEAAKIIACLWASLSDSKFKGILEVTIHPDNVLEDALVSSALNPPLV